MSRRKRAACAAALATLAFAAPAPAALPPDPAQCTSRPNPDACANYSFDTADWSVELGRHLVDEWVWAADGNRYACDTYEYLFEEICPPKTWIPSP